jgi:hypothetical protein
VKFFYEGDDIGNALMAVVLFCGCVMAALLLCYCLKGQ